jgi:hypothetical protein
MMLSVFKTAMGDARQIFGGLRLAVKQVERQRKTASGRLPKIAAKSPTSRK